MKVIALLGLVACLASLPALADCEEPGNAPHLPNGATASREEMVSAQKALKAYDAAVQDFTNCLQKVPGNEVKVNRAVDTLVTLADKFNIELRTFKQKSGA